MAFRAPDNHDHWVRLLHDVRHHQHEEHDGRRQQQRRAAEAVAPVGATNEAPPTEECLRGQRARRMSALGEKIGARHDVMAASTRRARLRGG